MIQHNKNVHRWSADPFQPDWHYRPVSNLLVAIYDLHVLMVILMVSVHPYACVSVLPFIFFRAVA